MLRKLRLYASYGANSRKELLGRVEPEFIFWCGVGLSFNAALFLFAESMSEEQGLWIAMASMIPLVYLSIVFCVVKVKAFNLKYAFAVLLENEFNQAEERAAGKGEVSADMLKQWVERNGIMQERVARLIRAQRCLVSPLALVLSVVPICYLALSVVGALPVLPNQELVAVFMQIMGYFYLRKAWRLKMLGIHVSSRDGRVTVGDAMSGFAYQILPFTTIAEQKLGDAQ